MKLSSEQFSRLKAYVEGEGCDSAQSDIYLSDCIDTIEALQSELAEANTALERQDAFWKQRLRVLMGDVDKTKVLVAGAYLAAAELPEKIYPRDSVFGLLKQNILALTPADAERSLQVYAQERVVEVQAILERDRSKVAECVTAMGKALQGYEWLIEGRGSYEWDDDRWHKEFEHACENIKEAMTPMVKIAADWSNCPRTAAATARLAELKGEKHV